MINTAVLHLERHLPPPLFFRTFGIVHFLYLLLFRFLMFNIRFLFDLPLLFSIQWSWFENFSSDHDFVLHSLNSLFIIVTSWLCEVNEYSPFQFISIFKYKSSDLLLFTRRCRCNRYWPFESRLRWADAGNGNERKYWSYLKFNQIVCINSTNLRREGWAAKTVKFHTKVCECLCWPFSYGRSGKLRPLRLL